MFTKRFWNPKILLFCLLVIFFFLFSLASLLRHQHFQSFVYDLGVYDQAIWLYSRFKSPISTIILRPDPIHTWADHFTPMLMLLAPLYWFTSDVSCLLILQVAIVVFGAYPIYKISQKNLKSDWLSLIMVASYLSFAGVQNAIVFDFHPETMATTFLAWLLYFLEKGNLSCYFLLLLLALGFKENIASLMAAFGTGLILVRRVKIGLTTLLMGVLWYLLATKIISPHFGPFIYEPQIPKSLGEIFFAFWQPTMKLETAVYTFASFLFLPVFYLPSLLVVLEQFFERFVASPAATRWTLGMHYSIVLAPFLVYGTVKVLTKFKLKWQLFFSLGIILAILTVNFKTHAALNILGKRAFYQEEDWMRNVKLVMAKIPPNAPLATQNNLGSHLTHREKIYLLPNIMEADYIFVDFHPGQNPNNFFPSSEEKLKSLITDLEKRGKYMVEYRAGEAILLKKR